ncbi:unnamed protein product [Caenorhabditis bovis]|uniref:Uncharacterized protein n=1 Tax=Caenorhabditis bovis TaxID=2654633 RepID=A0A8S1FB18_9PELO|nr:unnamed protein product [Caenorhabditis bovis]
MSVSSFLRRFSIDIDNCSSSSSSSLTQAPAKRRGRIAASIDSARRRFSLQHGPAHPSHLNSVDQDPVHLQSIALRGKGRKQNGSLPDLMQKRDSNAHPAPAKRVSVVATDRDRAYFLRHKNGRKQHSCDKVGRVFYSLFVVSLFEHPPHSFVVLE